MNPSFNIENHCEKLAKSNSEHGHQRAFFAWLNHCGHQHPDIQIEMAYAVPNGGKRDPVTAARLKAEGVKAGVLDICYAVPMLSKIDRQILRCGLYIEMKTTDGKVSDDQKFYIERLLKNQYHVAVCWSWRAAAECFVDYHYHNFNKFDYR